MPAYSLRRDYLLWSLLGVLAVFSLWHPAGIAAYPRLVDWDTVATLAGLLLLTAGIESSGFLHRLAWRVAAMIADERRLALFLVAAAALLSTFLTNDITLFVVVPLTVRLADHARLPLGRLVIFEALAVNAGSMLTPIGNPQNIFLWQSSGVHVQAFVWAMLPPTLIALACLLSFTLFAFPSRPLSLHGKERPAVLHRRLFLVSALLFVPFIAAADLHHAGYALLVVAALFVLMFRPVLPRVDWPLLLVFGLMFVDLRLLAALPLVRHGLESVNLGHVPALYALGAILSQFISNVPATILLSAYSQDWRTLAWAADMGGFGLVLGSLANLIALRLGGQRGGLLAFHAWSVPFFLLAGGLTGAWLLLR